MAEKLASALDWVCPTGLIVCLHGQDTLFSRCLTQPRCINGWRQVVPAHLLLGVTQRWTSIPSRGSPSTTRECIEPRGKISPGD